jgi:hypothetical protein
MCPAIVQGILHCRSFTLTERLSGTSKLGIGMVWLFFRMASPNGHVKFDLEEN